MSLLRSPKCRDGASNCQHFDSVKDLGQGVLSMERVHVEMMIKSIPVATEAQLDQRRRTGQQKRHGAARQLLTVHASRYSEKSQLLYGAGCHT